MKRAILILVFAAILTGCVTELDSTENQTPTNITDGFQGVDIEEYVADWIRDAPTYAYDGTNLTLQQHIVQESYPPQHVLTYTFTSTHAGYGDRSDQILAQVLTDHTITVRAANGEIQSAIIDESWNELTQEPARNQQSDDSQEQTVQMSFQPMQCEEYAWDEWYAQGNQQYVQQPTDEQLITDYYASQNIQIAVEKVHTDMFTCQACYTCQTTYYYQASLDASAQEQLQADGWS